MSKKIIDLTGEKFGLVEVLGLDEERCKKEKERKENGEILVSRIYWLCKCDCGKIFSVMSGNLKNIQSCGCLARMNCKIRNSKSNSYEEFASYYKGWDTKHENYFLISKEDYEEVKKYCWHKDKYDYWVTTLNKEHKILKLHQLIALRMDNTYKPSRAIVPDHITKTITSSKKDDNRRSNIRIVSQRENNRNT